MDQEVKDMFTQVLAAIHAQGTKIDKLIKEVAQIKEDITEVWVTMATKDDIVEVKTEIAGLHMKFDFLRHKVDEHDIAIWELKKQVR